MTEGIAFLIALREYAWLGACGICYRPLPHGHYLSEPHGIAMEFHLAEGVMQGDPLSPALACLAIKVREFATDREF
jgi:hypothetical protein